MPEPLAVTPAETIRSRQNARLKDLRQRLVRSSGPSDGLIAIEGEHLLREALRSGLRVHSIFVREDHAWATDWAEAGNSPAFFVANDAFDHACATESPQGIAALVEAPQWSFDALLQTVNSLFVVLAGLQDPGNVGTIIRTAEAFGATGILLTPGTVNPWNQKVLRAAAGSSFRLPVVSLEDESPLQRLQEKKFPIYACAARAGASILDTDLRPPMALVIGNEGAGIPQAVLRYCTATVHIPCPGPVESLNAAVAASVLLYEAARQRSHASIQGQP